MAVTFLLLLATSAITKHIPTAGRYVSGSLLGGVSSLIIFAPDMGLALSLLIRLLFSVVIVTAVYKPTSIKRVAKQTAYFFGVSFVFAGAMLFVASLPGISIVSYNNGVAYVDLSMLSLIGASVVCYVVTCLLNRITRHSTDGEILYSVKINHNGADVNISGILDTGNGLTDPFTGERLIIASQKDVLPLLNDDMIRYLCAGGEMCSRIRVVPCSTVSGQSLLPVFRADSVKISGDNKSVVLDNVGIAVCTTEIDNIILPPDIFENCRRRGYNEMAIH